MLFCVYFFFSFSSSSSSRASCFAMTSKMSSTLTVKVGKCKRPLPKFRQERWSAKPLNHQPPTTDTSPPAMRVSSCSASRQA